MKCKTTTTLFESFSSITYMVVCVSATMSILPVESMRSTSTRKPMALRIVLIISRSRLCSPALRRGRQTTGARRRMKGRVCCPWMNCVFCRCWLWNVFFVVQTLCQRAPCPPIYSEENSLQMVAGESIFFNQAVYWSQMTRLWAVLIKRWVSV